ncbi:MAG: phosphoribosylanthranilate isomerase [Alphaproteobacteria bacterium]
MSVEAKICGINGPEAMRAAIDGGASYVGLVFYPPSPRYVTPDEAAGLAALAGAGITRVGLFVDIDDRVLGEVLDRVPLEMLQLHGSESPDRVRDIQAKTGLPVMKAIKIATAGDVASAASYSGVADRLLFDAKAPPDLAGALPGGNALQFDWELLGGQSWPCPWMLSGGLDSTNVARAARISGALAVDVSSGVEDRPGVKNVTRIAEFLAAVSRL